jgi:hypothetical protein
MTPEQFLEFATVLPEPCLFLNSTGKILAVNTPAALLLFRPNEELQGKELWEFLIESKETVVEYLQACSGSQEMIPGFLTICTANGETVIYQAEGASIQLHTQIIIRLENRANPNNDLIKISQNIERTKATIQRYLWDLKNKIKPPSDFIHGNVPHLKENIRDLLELLDLYQKHYPQLPPEIEQKIEDIDLEFLQEDLSNLPDSMQRGAERIRTLVQSMQTLSNRFNKVEVNHSSCPNELITSLQEISQLLKMEEHF